MNQSTPTPNLARRRFLSLLGKGTLGLWIMSLIPTGFGLIKPAPRRAQRTRNKYAARISTPSQAVKRETRG